jgi:hypothetical protein
MRARRLVLGPLVVLLVAAGCGHPTPPPPTTAAGPTRDAQACRDQWHDLGTELQDRAAATEPSALPARWNSVVATVGYYATSATAADCPAALDAQRTAATALTAFSAQVRRFDPAYQLAQLRPRAATYVAGPLPKPTRVKGKRVPPVPKRTVRTALATLTASAPRAVADMADGWHELDTLDLTNAAAVRAALADLAFLAQDSQPFRACAQAAAVLRRLPGGPPTS